MIDTGENKEQLLNKYLSGEATSEELVLLSRMMDAGLIHKSDIDLLAVKTYVDPVDMAVAAQLQEGWEKLSAKIPAGNPPKRAVKRFLPGWSLAASAAVVALIVAIGGIAFYLIDYNARHLQFPSRLSESMPEETTLITGRGEVFQTDSMKSYLEVSSRERRLLFAGQQTSSTAEEESDINFLRVPFGKISHVVLSDGTKVWLNAGASLAFPTTFGSSNTREVFLSGEAYFDVKPGIPKSFVVNTKKLKFTVLGTSFEINANPGSDEVISVLESGSLKVQEKKLLFNDELILEPGQKSTYNLQNNDLSVTRVNTLEYTSWKDGYLLLNNHALSAVIEKISRYYNISFRVDDELAAQTFISGKFLLFSDFNTAIKVLSDLSGLKYELQGRSVVLKE